MRQPPPPETQQIFTPGILAGQVALVTGGGSGIGLATARELLRLGAQVLICGRSEARLAAARATLEGEREGATVLALPCDIREPAQVSALVSEAVQRLGAVDLLINNAGGQFPAPAQHLSANGFAAVVRNNLFGTFHVIQEVAKQSMIPRQRGAIVSVIANIYRGFPGMCHTGAARAGVENLTMSLAVEWAQFGIRVNAVAPGIIASAGIAQYPEEIVAMSIRQTPLKRAGTVEEVAAAIVFLCSPAAGFITGATLRIDGGQSLWGDVWQIPD
jgi:citronellol/citronellal dehydrogenase